MPRVARKISNSGLYHVVMRGINRQTIFEDAEDYEKFLSLLLWYKEKCKYRIHAWCLMDNHVHLLIEVLGDPISIVFKKIGTNYATYFNTKYQRVGHLFQDRFGSEVVEDDSYFLSAIRYIHMNPVKAGICKEPDEYEFSSYKEYVGDSLRTLAYTNMALDMTGLEEFKRYTVSKNEDVFLDVPEFVAAKLTDEAARGIIEKCTGCKNATEFQMLNNYQRDAALKEIIKQGVAVNQAARLTGWSRPVIRRAIEKA